MKKLIAMTGIIALTAISAFTVQAKESPKNLNENVGRVASQQRAKQMCAEWPGCEEWMIAQEAKNPTFRIVDAEVEQWLSKWEGGQSIWLHRFYVKITENGKTKTYRFLQNYKEGNYTYENPAQIKKFPGHPFTANFSQHIKLNYEKDIATEIKNFPFFADWLFSNRFYFSKAIPSQYIVKYDEQGNAIWGLSLYVNVSVGQNQSRFFRFRSQQTKAGGNYAHDRIPQEMKRFPTLPQMF